MVLDINLFREDRGGNPDLIRESQRRRFSEVKFVDDVLEADAKWRHLRGKLDLEKKEKGKIQKDITAKMKAKEKADDLMAKKKENDALIAATEKELDEAAAARDKLLPKVGNLVHESVPVFDDEKDNKIERVWGEPKMSNEGLLNHVDLWHCIGGADYDRGNNVAGNRGYFLRGVGVLLNQALINFGMNFLNQRKYTMLQTPFFMQKGVMGKCAQLADFDEQLYKVTGEGEDKYLIATSEQPIACYHMDEWMDPVQLPIRYAGYSTCFRKEAGSHGRDTLGIFRVHQFEKIEQFCITSPDDNQSWNMHEEMLKTAEDFYKALGLPYQVVNIVSGELNDAAAKKYDLEAWFPASQTYRELVSCSNCTDFQARRLEIRYGHKKMGDKEKKYVHMLNSTLCATERALCCIVENYQTPEGVIVPEALQPYMAGVKFLPFVNKPKIQKEKKEKKGKK